MHLQSWLSFLRPKGHRHRRFRGIASHRGRFSSRTERLEDRTLLAAAMVDVRLVATPTNFDTGSEAQGEVATLPDNEVFVHEWQPFTVEVWANVTDRNDDGINRAAVTLNYNQEFFTATSIVFDGAFDNIAVQTIDDTTGTVNIDASSSRSDAGDDAFTRIARVVFVPLATDNVPVDLETRFIGPYDFQLGLSSAAIETVLGGAATTTIGAAPETEVWAVPYDIDDNDVVDFVDLTFFFSVFTQTIEDGDPRNIWIADNSKDGVVGFVDVGIFASSFLTSKLRNSDIQFPPNFRELWKRPPLQASLANDTAPNNTINNDGVTSDETVGGTTGGLAPGAGNIIRFHAGFGATPISQFFVFDAAPFLNSSGAGQPADILLDPAILTQINGRTPLGEGQHTLRLRSEDQLGNFSEIQTLTFTIDKTPPSQLLADLDTEFDSGTQGDMQTIFRAVTISGQTDPGAMVAIDGTAVSVFADGTGLFGLTDVPLALGQNDLVIRSYDAAGNSVSLNKSITVLAANSTTTIEDTQSNPIVIDPAPFGGAPVSHFKITNIVNGNLFQNDGTTPISNGDFVAVADVQSGLRFAPLANSNSLGSFDFESSTDGQSVAAPELRATATITVTPVGDTPTAASITTLEDTQSATIVITRNAVDGSEVTHFQITGIANGTLFQNDGTTAISDNAFITVAEAQAGLKFTPTANFFGNGNFTVTPSLDGTSVAVEAGLATSTITVTPVGDDPVMGNRTTLEDTQSSPIVITQNAVDLGQVTHFQITDISNGTLFQNNGTTAIGNNAFITIAEAQAGLKFTPAANSFVAGELTVRPSFDGSTVATQAGTTTSTITVTPVGDTPTVTDITTLEDAQSAAIVINRNAADGNEVTHFKITGIANGTLFQNNGTTEINSGDFITFGEGNAGLKFTPDLNSNLAGSFTVEASQNGTTVAAQSGTATSTITVTPVGDTPTVTGITTLEDTQSGLIVINRNAADGNEVTHFKITGIANGSLFQADGTTPISNNQFITVAQGNAGLKFTPDANSNLAGSFTVEASQNGTTVAGQSGTAASTITVTPVGDTPVVPNIVTLINTISGPIVINRNAADGSEVSHFKITGITNGTLFQNDGTTPINNGDFITFGEGNAGVRFLPAVGVGINARFDVEASQDGLTVTSQTGKATSTIAIGSEPPFLITPIPKVLDSNNTSTVTILNSDPALPLIDLLAVFGDPDSGDVLTFTVQNDNPGLVSVQVTNAQGNPVSNGQFLKITPVAFSSGQNRTPVNVTVTASDIGNMQVSDSFTIVVEPMATAEVVLVAVSSPTVIDNPFLFTSPQLLNESGIDNAVGFARFSLSPDESSLAYTIYFRTIDLDGQATTNTTNDDLKAISIRRGSVGNNTLAFQVMDQSGTDNNFTVDLDQRLVSGVWESGTEGFNNFLVDLRAGNLFLSVETKNTNLADDTFSADINASFEVIDPTAVANSIGQAIVGRSYFLEVWARDRLEFAAGATSVGVGQGLGSVIVDVDFDATGSDVVALTHNGVFDAGTAFNRGSFNNNTGQVTGFGAATLSKGRGISTGFGRLGYIEVLPQLVGNQTFNLKMESSFAGVNRFGSGSVLGELDASQIELTGVTVKNLEPSTFQVIPADSQLTLTAELLGISLDEQFLGSSVAGFTGDIGLIVDDLANPTSIQITNSKLNALNNATAMTPSAGSVNPGNSNELIGNSAGSDPAQFGLAGSGPATGIFLAIRNFFADISSPTLAVDAAGFFNTSSQNWQGADVSQNAGLVSKSQLDFAAGPSWQAGFLAGLNFADNGTSGQSSLVAKPGSPGVYRLTIPVERDFAVTVSTVISLHLSGLIVAELDTNPPLIGTASSTAGNAISEVDAATVFDAAVSAWKNVMNPTVLADLQLNVADLPGSQLGAGRATKYTSTGLPTAGVVTIDINAAGVGWYTSPSATPFHDGSPLEGGTSFTATAGSSADGRYDLYTVLVHEIGHVLGFSSQNASFSSHVETAADGDPIFVGADFTAFLSKDLNHLDATQHPNDVMNSRLEPSVRKLPSQLDFQILNAVYESASSIPTDENTGPSAALQGTIDANALDLANTLNEVEAPVINLISVVHNILEEAPRFADNTFNRELVGEYLDTVLDHLAPYLLNTIKQNANLPQQLFVQLSADVAERFSEKEVGFRIDLIREKSSEISVVLAPLGIDPAVTGQLDSWFAQWNGPIV